MIHPFQKFLETCFLARELSDEYLLHLDEPPQTVRNVLKFVRFCEGHLGKKIRICKLRYNKQEPEDALHGAYVEDAETFHIVIIGNMNYCWNRFVICKELFHAVLRDEENRSIKINEHVEDMVTKDMLMEPPGAAKLVEQLAEIAAMEFLFPFKDRQAILKSAEETGVPVKYHDIAQRYKTPQVYIEPYLSEPMMGLFGTIFSHFKRGE